jgi:GDP-L-fucose synthase
VGGIWANQSHPAGFLYDNLAIAQNVIHSAWKNGVKRLIFLGSSCIYPRDCAQPIKESYLLQGVLEKTNEAYALAKIVGLKLCEYYRKEYGVDFFSVMPTNLYGPGDYYHLEHAHVIPSLMRKFHEAKIKELSSVTVWGSGKPRREFLHVDDLATAIYQLLHLDHIPMNWLNIGTGVDHSIAELGLMLKEVVGFQGDIVYDTSKPDGTPQKLLDISEMRALNWQPKIPLLEGLKTTYDLFVRAYREGSMRG